MTLVYESRFDIFREIFAEHAEREEWLDKKHPWVRILCRWIAVALLATALVASIVYFAKDRIADKVETAVTTAMDEEHAAMMQAAEEAQKKAEEEEDALQIREAQALARALWGIRNFTEKYHYTRADLITYMMCPKNRSDETGKSIEDVLAEPKQFMAYSTMNTLDKDLYDLSLEFVADMHAGKLPECDTKFRYAVCNEYGVFLVDDPGKAVPERWHA